MWASMVGVYAAFGMVLAAIPPMITEVRTDLDMGRGAMGLALGAWTAIYIVTASPAGRIVDRLGIKTALTLGGLSLVASSLLRSFAVGPISLWLTIAIMGIGGPLVSASAPTLCGQWFVADNERELAMSTYNLGPGIGSLLTLFATNSILLPWLGDWRTVLRFEAGVALAATLIWFVVAQRAPEQPAKRPERSTVSMVETSKALLASADVRHVLILGALTFFVGHSLNNWLIDAVTERASVTATAASNWVSIVGVAGMGLLFLLPRLTNRFGRPALLIAAWAAVITGILMVGFGSGAVAIGGIIPTALRSVMIPLILITLMEADGVDESNIGAANGLWFSCAQVGAVAGPFLVGVLADSSAGFTGAMTMLAIVAGVAALKINRHQPAATLQSR